MTGTELTRITQHGKLPKRKPMTGSLLPGKFSLSLHRQRVLFFHKGRGIVWKHP